MEILSKLHFRKKDHFQIDDILDLIQPGDIFIDCGANLGQETIPIAQKGATVYAFEPNPYAFDELKKNTSEFENVNLINKAVWDRESKMKLYMHENNSQDHVKWSVAASLLGTKTNVNKEDFVEVDVIDLIEFIKNLNKRIKILKIDVEGAEYEILLKLIETETYKLIDTIFVETHEQKIPDLKTKIDEIKKLIKAKKIKNINLNWI